MNKAFEPMSARQQEHFRATYLAFLRERDGVPDMKAQTFDVREKFFAAIDRDPVSWMGPPPVDQQVFDRNHARATPEPGLDPATLWALATAKTNRAERFGVEYSLAYKPHATDALTDPHAYIQVEECYHTRILRDALRTIGLTMEVMPPGFTARTMVRSMVRLPAAYANVLVLCGEVFGVAIFSLLLEKARTLFASQPETLARIETLFGQILVDEVGHVQYIRSTLAPARLQWARRIMPLVAWGALRDIPELIALFGRDVLMQRVASIDVESAAASYPDRLILPAA
ncbi:hypothetical protein ACNOYE_10535 [Nannocystaceae bacterium ST9]